MAVLFLFTGMSAQDKQALFALQKNIKLVNRQYPIQSSLGCRIIKEFIEGNSLIIQTEVDSRLASFDEMRDRAELMKKTFLGMHASNPHLVKKTKMVTDCGMQITYRYINKQTGDKFDVVLEYEELIGDATVNKREKASIETIENLLKASVDSWCAAVKFLLSSKVDKKDNFKTKEEVKDFHAHYKEKMKHEESYEVFMCNDKDDDIMAYDSFGKKVRVEPVISIEFIEKASGKSRQVKKSILELSAYLEKQNFSVDTVNVETVQVYLVDQVVKMNSRDDIGNFVYCNDHIYAIANYELCNGVYNLVNKQDYSFDVKRGKSYWGIHRDEEKILKENGVVVLLGNVSIKVFCK